MGSLPDRTNRRICPVFSFYGLVYSSERKGIAGRSLRHARRARASRVSKGLPVGAGNDVKSPGNALWPDKVPK